MRNAARSIRRAAGVDTAPRRAACRRCTSDVVRGSPSALSTPSGETNRARMEQQWSLGKHSRRSHVELRQDERIVLTVEEAARQLGIGRSLAWRLVNRGDLPSVKLGRLVRVPKGELEAWIHQGAGDRSNV